MKSYHVGLLKADDKIIIQCRRNIDFLSCEIWKYCGQRLTTKAALKAKKSELLAAINKTEETNFKRIEID